jgi:hypothetical protein
MQISRRELIRLSAFAGLASGATWLAVSGPTIVGQVRVERNARAKDSTSASEVAPSLKALGLTEYLVARRNCLRRLFVKKQA